jgi:hypothetical protein
VRMPTIAGSDRDDVVAMMWTAGDAAAVAP